MEGKKRDTGMTRREFVQTVGLAGLAAAVAGTPGALAATEKPGGTAPAQTMPKRKLGKTGVEVPILNLGCMLDTINNQLLLRQALKWGVTFWDTAEAYGDGLSEEGLGRFFARNPGARKEVCLVTKLVPQGGDLTRRLEDCLKRLQTPYVDVFYIHAISGIDEMKPAYREWAGEMKRAGKFKFFGFSTHTNMEDCLLGAARLDWIDVIMTTYNYQVMHSPKMQEAVQACAKAGIGLVAMKTQSGGPSEIKTQSEAELKMANRFMERGFTDKQAKLKVVWETPQIASICSQMPNLTILAANVAAARDQTKLAREDLEAVRRYAQETSCDYCAGCGAICQAAVGGAVAVSEVMRCLMYHQSYGDPELARLTFAGLPEETWRRLTQVDYTRAEQACPNGLAIGRLMRRAEEIFA
ncbi:MAG: aldo/keto reductase [Deltaproteobacteria bacterium]|nr:aldo/keto reductase [Deltaproteobacteria bacterium]